MPDPIQSTNGSSSYPLIDPERTAQENAGQVCLPPAPLSVASDESATPPTAPTSPAVQTLVARFSAPTGSHPPIEPSLGKALGDCALELGGAALAVAQAGISGGSLALAVLAGGRALVSVGTAQRCIQRDEAEQVARAQTQNDKADCERDGTIPLLKTDGSVICATP